MWQVFQPAGGEFRVNTETKENQLNSSIGLDADGNFVSTSGGRIIGALNIIGTLDMKKNSNIINVKEPYLPQDAVNKHYVDTKCATKSYVDAKQVEITATLQSTMTRVIAITAEQHSRLTENKFEWSFGNGSSDHRHGKVGFTMMSNGRILRMGIATVTQSGIENPSVVKVNVVVDGVDQGVGISKEVGKISSHIVFPEPIKILAGSTINFISKASSNTTHNIVSLLIELDLQNEENSCLPHGCVCGET